MATPAQLLANRANAARSTGPRTAAGKRVSAANATRHGFRSQTVLLAGDDPAEYEALLARLMACFRPAGVHTRRAVREMADAEWRLARVREYLSRTLDAAIAAQTGADPIELQRLAWLRLLEEDKSFRQLVRFEARFQRQYERAVRDLLCAPIENETNEPDGAAAPVARNSPCPCGSGEKYKRCCGQNAPPVLFPHAQRGGSIGEPPEVERKPA